MAIPAITVEALPAGYGDCLLISCPIGRRTWRLLIDTGPDECLPTLVDRLKVIPLNAQGRRRIDLAVISHIDHDHIGGAARLFADTSLKLEFGDIWFNAPSQPVTRGVWEGVGLAAVLGAAARGLPWNLAFGGRDGVTGSEPFVELQRKRGEPRLAQNTAVALASVVHVFVLRIFGADYPRDVSALQVSPQLSAFALEAVVDDLKASRAWQAVHQAKEASRARLPEHQGEWFGWLIGLPHAELIDLLALCGALTVNALPGAGGGGQCQRHRGGARPGHGNDMDAPPLSLVAPLCQIGGA